MAFVSWAEGFQLLAMVIVLGLIFRGIFLPPSSSKTPSSKKPKDPLMLTSLTTKNIFFQPKKFWREFIFAVIVVSPAVVLHEAAHKFVGLALGEQAVFHAHFLFLLFGLFLRLINSAFIFFVPGYVSISGSATALDSFFIAVAGPLTNLLLFAVAFFLLRFGIAKKYTPYLILTKRINLFLFFFNMLPFPPFDGFHVVTNLWQLFF